MSIFTSSAEAEDVFATFLERVATDPGLQPTLVSAATSFRARYSDPDCAVCLVTTENPPRVERGEAALAEQVDVELFMTADDGHRFWLGALNIPMALARRKVKLVGQKTPLLKLLPAIQSAFAMYPAFLEERGLADRLG